MASRIFFYPPNLLRWSEAFSFNPSGKPSEIDVHNIPVNKAFCVADLATMLDSLHQLVCSRVLYNGLFNTLILLNKIPFICAEMALVYMRH